jgi:hypothetical protein
MAQALGEVLPLAVAIAIFPVPIIAAVLLVGSEHGRTKGVVFVLAPVAAALVLGERSRDALDGLRNWMARNNATIMTVLFLLIGAKLVGDAISGFSG